MSKSRTTFVCQNCGGVSNRWQGKCESCGEWNTISEEADAVADAVASYPHPFAVHYIREELPTGTAGGGTYAPMRDRMMRCRRSNRAFGRPGL